ncbi:xylulokinase [Bifidobacterium gallicum]|nr:FGGY-family carbohydrate kinase [Bifidobacterium gallicum]KFI59072.1 ATPase [Bifidobacterium gallicum DSM 20093 = LMG 11596]
MEQHITDRIVGTASAGRADTARTDTPRPDTSRTDEAAESILAGRTSLGVEFGSTTIKAVLIDEHQTTLATGDFAWVSHLDSTSGQPLWSYDEQEIWQGLQHAYAQLAANVTEHYGVTLTRIGAIGISAMMHGYLAFNGAGEMLTPFRTWQNTNTHEAHERLSALFSFNIPERWSVAHLYQALLDDEAHLADIAYLTTLAGYVHWKLTGRRVLGIGDASGMFPIDPVTHGYDERYVDLFNALPEMKRRDWTLTDILPEPLVAGQFAGQLTKQGAALLDPSGHLESGIAMAPPEGDAGTGMVATNSVRKRTGNVSAGTSIFATVVLEHPLRELRPEIDIVATPSGDLAGMSHANNFTSDLNAWVTLFGEFAQAAGMSMPKADLFALLFQAAVADDVDLDCGGLLNFPFRSGEFLVGLEQGRPLFVRSPEARMTLGNMMRAQLCSAFSPVKIGMDIMTKDEGVRVDSLVAHGGIFATPKVAQSILAAAFNTAITVMDTAARGGAWGMAVLADYLSHDDESLADFLDARVFCSTSGTTLEPDSYAVAGFERFFSRFLAALPVERAAVETVPLDAV